MKYLLFIFFSFYLSGNCSAQNEIQQWRYGVGIGSNSMRLGRGDRSFFSSDQTQLQFVGKRSSLQGNISASYRLNRSFRLLGNLGVTHAKCLAYRKTVTTELLFLDDVETKLDTVMQKYLLIDLPIYFRWQIISLENDNFQGIKPFLDFGVNFKIPLINKSDYRQTQMTEPLFGATTSQYNSGNLEVQPLTLYVAIGFFLGEHFTLSYSWAGVRSKAENNPKIKYYSPVKTLSLSYFL